MKAIAILTIAAGGLLPAQSKLARDVHVGRFDEHLFGTGGRSSTTSSRRP